MRDIWLKRLRALCTAISQNQLSMRATSKPHLWLIQKLYRLTAISVRTWGRLRISTFLDLVDRAVS